MAVLNPVAADAAFEVVAAALVAAEAAFEVVAATLVAAEEEVLVEEEEEESF